MTKQALTRAARPLIRFLSPSLAAIAATITCVVAGTALAQDAKLTLSPALVVTGPTDRLAIESDGSFDLSKVTAQQIAISPSNDVRGVKVLDAGPKSVGIALDLSANAQNGKRTVSVTSGGKTASGTLEVLQGAALVIEAPGAASKNKAVTTTINVSSRAGVDLSQVKAADVKLTPADFTVIEIVNQANDGLTLGLKVPKAKQNAAATVRIGGDINLAAEFSLAGAHAPKTCAKLQHCCDGQASACTSCRPIDQVCKKPGS